ncbi:MAG TPA: hypothetical protein PLR79_08255, partial [Acinetobacter sp.]|nr:hypothetical protein [Acinetobacter sp.]
MAAALAFAGVQATSQIIGGFLQADMVRRQAEIQAGIAEFNAQLSEYDGWKTEAYGSTLIASSQNQIDQVRGTSKVYAASKGIKSEGSLAEINAQNELNSTLNKIDIDNRVTEQAMGYRRQASQTRLNSRLNSIGAATQATSLQIGSIVQAGGTMASSYIRGQEASKIKQ